MLKHFRALLDFFYNLPYEPNTKEYYNEVHNVVNDRTERFGRLAEPRTSQIAIFEVDLEAICHSNQKLKTY